MSNTKAIRAAQGRRSADLDWAVEKLRLHLDARTFGTISFVVEAGRIVCVQATSKEKPE